jgi:predicted Rossmann fold nucleotide-binding protein DprA/Smf involved in DNA uptake
MKIIIAGGREFKDYDILSKMCDSHFMFNKYPIDEIEIVSGMARGADKLGEKYATEKGYTITPFPADWKNLGISAGHIRNEEMAKYGDVLIAFWDSESTGTKNMIETARKYGLKVYVVLYKQ